MSDLKPMNSEDKYKYTNKGRVHEFDLNLLSPDERKKFEKMSDKQKQRFITSVELEQMPSMFDEVSLKSVVYPDQDSDITSIQQANAKYSDLINLLEDPKFKEMEYMYLKYPEIQKYILDNCNHIQKYDIELLLKLKPDMTVNQFINYFKNIKDDKNLVEMNKIQKILKNPYSDDLLKELINKSDIFSNQMFKTIVDNNFERIDMVKDGLHLVLNPQKDWVNKGTTERPNMVREYINSPIPEFLYNYIPFLPKDKGNLDLTSKEKSDIQIAYAMLSRLIKNVEKQIPALSQSLESIGFKVYSPKDTENDEDIKSVNARKYLHNLKEILFNYKTFTELKKLITEREWEAIRNIIPSLSRPYGNKYLMDDLKRKRKEEAPRDSQNDDLSPNFDDLSNEKEPPITPANVKAIDYPGVQIPEIFSLPSSQIQIQNETNKEDIKTKIKNLKEHLRDLIDPKFKRVADAKNLLDNECSCLSIAGSEYVITKISAHGENTSYKYDLDKIFPIILEALKKGKTITEYTRKNTGKSKMGEVNFNTPEMDEIGKQLKELEKDGGSIFSRIKNTFKAPEAIEQNKLKIAELQEIIKTQNASLKNLEKTINELTNRVNELSVLSSKSYVEKQIKKPLKPKFIDEINSLKDKLNSNSLKNETKPEKEEINSLKNETKPEKEETKPKTWEDDLRAKMEERRKDISNSEDSEESEEWGEGIHSSGKIKIQQSDMTSPITLKEFFDKYL